MRSKLRTVIGIVLLTAAMIYSATSLIDPRTANATGGTCCSQGSDCDLGLVCCVVHLECCEVPCNPDTHKNNYCKTRCFPWC